MDREFGRAADDEGYRDMVRGTKFAKTELCPFSRRERVGVRGYGLSMGRTRSPGAARRPLPMGEVKTKS
jgi:hypothetical protein